MRGTSYRIIVTVKQEDLSKHCNRLPKTNLIKSFEIVSQRNQKTTTKQKQ